jgi:hypothetical protein
MKVHVDERHCTLPARPTKDPKQDSISLTQELMTQDEEGAASSRQKEQQKSKNASGGSQKAFGMTHS